LWLAIGAIWQAGFLDPELASRGQRCLPQSTIKEAFSDVIHWYVVEPCTNLCLGSDRGHVLCLQRPDLLPAAALGKIAAVETARGNGSDDLLRTLSWCFCHRHQPDVAARRN